MYINRKCNAFLKSYGINQNNYRVKLFSYYIYNLTPDRQCPVLNYSMYCIMLCIIVNNKSIIIMSNVEYVNVQIKRN